MPVLLGGASALKAKLMVVTAAEHGHVDDLRLLIAAKANIKETVSGRSATQWAVQNGHAAAIDVLLRAKASVNCVNVKGENWDVEVLRVLIAAKSDINRPNETPLFWAVRDGNFEIVKLLLATKANTELHPISIGCTPLVLSVHQGDTELTRALIDAKANLEARSFRPSHRTPVALAIENQHMATLELLVSAKADLESVCDGRSTPLINAVRYGTTTDALQILMNAKVDVNGTEYSGAVVYGKFNVQQDDIMPWA